MPQLTSVVTPVRFEQGLSYSDFLAQAAVNVDKFEENYRTVPLTEDDISFFRKAASHPDGPAKILALAEAWCGDVYRELPTAARIAEVTGFDLRVFPRDENPDIMDEFVSNGGKSRAIPVFVFYTRDHQYITHFTERSASHMPVWNWQRMKRERSSISLRMPPSEIFRITRGRNSCRRSSPESSLTFTSGERMRSKRSAFSLHRQSEFPMQAELKPALPLVYTIRGCAACVKLLHKLDADGVAYEERRVELDQNTLNEARKLGALVPIVVWPDGKVEQGFGDTIGCFI